MVTQDSHFEKVFGTKKPIIGMVHLKALPGAPKYDPEVFPMEKVEEIAIEEALLLQKAGVDGIQIENIWDYPYVKGGEIGYETVAAMAAIARSIKKEVTIPFGINCHLNGGKAALAIAVSVGAKWIRVFEWVNAYVSHAGIMEGIGGMLARYRSFVKAESIQFFCDVHVKHGSHFLVSDRSIEEMAYDAESEGAEALIVTGFETGQAPTPQRVKSLNEKTMVPLLIGSGLKRENLESLLPFCDGAIVGSDFKKEGDWKKPVDFERVYYFMEQAKKVRGDQ